MQNDNSIFVSGDRWAVYSDTWGRYRLDDICLETWVVGIQQFPESITDCYLCVWPSLSRSYEWCPGLRWHRPRPRLSLHSRGPSSLILYPTIQQKLLWPRPSSKWTGIGSYPIPSLHARQSWYNPSRALSCAFIAGPICVAIRLNGVPSLLSSVCLLHSRLVL